MAKDVTLYQKSTSYHYSSVDSIETKGLDEETVIPWIPEMECITGYKKITKNGQYLASADSVAGYTAVFVNVPTTGISGVGPDGEMYRVIVTPSGYLSKTKLSTGESVPLSPDYIAIPAQEYQGSNITSFSDDTVNVIGESAFKSCVSLATVNFPNVHTVKTDAFSGCTVLSSISFPKLNVIGEGAFQNCVALTSISFPECTYIGSGAFKGCSGLQTIEFLGTTPAILENKDAFSGTTVSIYVPTNLYDYYTRAKVWSDIASMIVSSSSVSPTPEPTPEPTPPAPDQSSPSYDGAYMSDTTILSFYDSSVTSIGVSTFKDCINLSQISFPNVTRVKQDAFAGCVALESVSMSTLQTIESGAFSGCISLSVAQINSVSAIGDSAFKDCVSLKQVNIWSTRSVGQNAFANCYNLDTHWFTGISFVRSIESGAFLNCSKLSYLQFNNSVSLSGENIFAGCNNLGAVFLLSDESSLCGLPANFSNEFESTPMMESSYLGYYGSVYVPDSLYSNYVSAEHWSEYSSRLGRILPSHCYEESTMTYYSNSEINVIGESAFYANTSLVSISIPDVDYIFPHAFDNCYSLNGLSASKLKMILNYAFSDCSNFSFIDAPEMRSVGQEAFYYCSRLTSVSFPKATTIGNGAFYSCSRLTSVVLPLCESIASFAFNNCPITSISLPNVSFLGVGAFTTCKSLESVYLMSNSIVEMESEIVNGNLTYAFLNTPINKSSYLGHFGSVYVPSSLINAYKVAEGWSTYSDRIVGI